MSKLFGYLIYILFGIVLFVCGDFIDDALDNRISNPGVGYTYHYMQKESGEITYHNTMAEFISHHIKYNNEVWLAIVIGIIVSVVMRYNVNKAVAARQSADDEKMRGVVEMSGAVCHELSQPMQCVQGAADLVNLVSKDCKCANVSKIQGALTIMEEGLRRSKEVLSAMNGITRYATKRYMKGDIIDIASASNRIEEAKESIKEKV